MRKVLLISLLLTGGVATAQENVTYQPGQGKTLKVVRGTQTVAEVPMPCTLDRVFVYGEGRVVATCKDKPGLLLVDTREPNKPKPLEIQSYQGRLKDVYWVGDRLWVDVADAGSWPLRFEETYEEPVVDASEPLLVEEPPVEEETEVIEEEVVVVPEVQVDTSPTQVGKVLKFEDRDVIVDLGTDHGFKKGDSVEFFETFQIDYEKEKVNKDETIAFGRIKTISANRAVVEVGLNEALATGTPVRFTKHQYSPNYISPPRNAGMTEFSFTARPFIALGTLGGGAIIDASLTRRFEAPVALDVRLAPLGFALTNKGNAGVFAAHAFVSYDTRLFQVGLGAGASKFEVDDLPYMLSPGQEAPEATRFGFSAGQFVRLGARDGLNLTATTNFVVRDEQFDFGGLSAEMQIPMGSFLSDTWLVMRGGGGLPGHTFGEVGLRTLVRGNGNKGSVFVTPTLGGADITTRSYGECEWSVMPGEQCLIDTDYGGPMVGVTVEWRP